MTISPDRLKEVFSNISLLYSRNHLNYPRSEFEQYVSPEYRNSSRRETDEAYRMFEHTLLHKPTGLRIVYTTTESYDGESVDYRVIDLFIITSDNKHLAVQDVDFEKQLILTPAGPIAISETKKRVRTDEPAGPPKPDNAESEESFIDRIRKSPHSEAQARALLGFLEGQNRRGRTKARKIELLKKLIAEIEADKGLDTMS